MLNLNLSVDEVLEIGEQIERNGAVFYRKAATIIEDAEAKAKLIGLAEAEDNHEAVFRGMRESMVPEDKRISVYDHDDIVALHLQALASREVFVAGQEPGEILKGDETMADIVKIAIGKEWDTILYYSAIRDLMVQESDRDLIDDMIRQEEGHVRDLQACV